MVSLSLTVVFSSIIHLSVPSVVPKDHLIKTFCYAHSQTPYSYFSSKTAYNSIYYKNDPEIIPDECKPKQLWMLVRHGTRYPTMRKMEAFKDLSKLRDRIVHNHEKFRGSLCNHDIRNLKSWKFENLPLSDSDHLTNQGYEDLRGIGNRTNKKFSKLFKRDYSTDLYKVEYTPHEKTKTSAAAFMNGIFGKDIEIPTPTADDLMIKIFPNCDVLPIPGADDLPEGTNERTLFKEGPVVDDMVRNVSYRLGFKHPLLIDEIDDMYEMCRYKKSWVFDEVSPWCACFTDEDLKVLEYIGDLSYYYNSGYGNSANLRTGCPLVQDLFYSFRKVIRNNNNGNQYNAKFYFGHSTTIYNFISRFGLAKDTVRITHENYYNMSDRLWRTSYIGPFSANFAAVLLKCDKGQENRVVMYHNETPIKLEICKGYVCSWEVLEKHYRTIIDPSTCNFNFCEKFGSPTEDETNTPETIDTEQRNSIYIDHRNTIDSDQRNTINKTTSNSRRILSLQMKSALMEREFHLTWLFVSFAVCLVVLFICNHYTTKKRQMKMIQIGYEKMNPEHLNFFYD